MIQADDAKKSDETTRKEELQKLFQRKKEKAEARKQEAQQKKEERHAEFKLVTDREDMLNPDLSHDHKKSAAQRVFRTEDYAASGSGWKSPAFSLVDDKNHPAVTGTLPRGVQEGAGHKSVNTNAVDAARGVATGHSGTTGVTGTTTGARV